MAQEYSPDYKSETAISVACPVCGNPDCAQALEHASKVKERLTELDRLKNIVIEKAKAERVIYEAELTPTWVFEIWQAQKAVHKAVDALIAFEKEHKTGE